MKILAIDTENNTWNKGAPFDRRFKNVCWSWADSSGSGAVKTDSSSLIELAERIGQADLLIGFNLKYDLHVLRNLGVTGWEDKRLWDCQIGQFIFSNQTQRYPSLNESLNTFGLEAKLSVVDEEYWSKGIQTDEIPWDVLSAYAAQDAQQTLALYHAQIAALSPQKQRMVRLQSMDLLTLQEMEWNGLRFDEQLCSTRAEETRNKISEITDQLRGIYPDIPINFNSGDHLSAFLYGGQITEERRVHDGFFKTGKRAGEPKFRREEVVHDLPRLVVPLRGSELKKDGYFATNADTLLKLRGNKKTQAIIELIQRQTRLQTLLSKTYEGIIKSNRENNWEPGELHGQFNQCVVQTGRLSSNNPNSQNFDGAADDLFVSRYQE